MRPPEKVTGSAGIPWKGFPVLPEVPIHHFRHHSGCVGNEAVAMAFSESEFLYTGILDGVVHVEAQEEFPALEGTVAAGEFRTEFTGEGVGMLFPFIVIFRSFSETGSQGHQSSGNGPAYQLLLPDASPERGGHTQGIIDTYTACRGKGGKNRLGTVEPMVKPMQRFLLFLS